MKINVIVIDDDEDVRDSFADLLQLNNIDVAGTGCNGKEAVELYQKHKPNVVFMDVFMPEYDGLYGLKNIKEYDPNAIVVLVTGSRNIGSELNNCNATAVIAKPMDMDKIKSIMNKFCIH